MCAAIPVFALHSEIYRHMGGEAINPELPVMPKAFVDYQKELHKKNATFAGGSSKPLFNMYKKFKDGGIIEIIDGYKKKSDHKDLVSISRFFAQNGDEVKITTPIHYKDKKYREVFGGLIGTRYERKCPDFIINGMYYEYESYEPPFNKEKISNMISNGLRQSSNIIINNNKGASDRYIRRNIIQRVNKRNFRFDIDKVWLYEKGTVRLLYKKTVGS
jgi:hypothetical protein